MNTSTNKPLARAGVSFDPHSVAFGTDGWRAIIGEDFTVESLAQVIDAAARVFRNDNPTSASAEQILIVGYDCRENAAQYATLAATILASYGFRVLVSNTYCPTPTLCWSIANNESAVGGIMLTSSHNPAEYLGVKLRMRDGGASPKHFSDRVEAELQRDLPASFSEALARAEALAAQGNTGSTPQESPEAGSGASAGEEHTSGVPELFTSLPLEYVDLVSPYLQDLKSLVDKDAIAAANLRVVVDPMYGAGRAYLASLFVDLGVEVVEIHAEADYTFAGLHPEPILPWIQEGLDKVAELGFDACFITDGDADRLGAGASDGSFVNPHKILALVCALLVEDKGQKGRVVRTLSGSNLIKRQCERLDLELTTTPIGFKWIYEEMLKGDVILGGEESGGIGIPSHVCERDGLLMALLLTELMAKKGKALGELVDDLLTTLGHFDYARRDLKITHEQKESFLQNVCAPQYGAEHYQNRFDSLDEHITQVDYRDGIKFDFSSDAWLLARPSGTEPLVRVYAEATTSERVEELLDAGCKLVTGE